MLHRQDTVSQNGMHIQIHQNDLFPCMNFNPPLWKKCCIPFSFKGKFHNYCKVTVYMNACCNYPEKP